MKIQTIRRHLMLSLLCLAATLAPTQSAAAAQISYDAASYELQVDFPNNQIRANMVVRVTGHVNGSPSVDTVVIPVKCTANQGVRIDNEQARFVSAYQGAITCDLPSFAEAVYKLTNGGLKLAAVCTCRDPYLAANLSLTEDSKWTGNPDDRNPIFYHPDVQFFAPYVDAPGVAATRMSHSGAPQTVSAPYALRQSLNAIWAGSNPDLLFAFADFGGWHSFLQQHNLSTLPGSLFWANGQQLNASSRSTDFPATTDAVTIYIGYNPVTNTYFDGTIERLAVDPPHWGI
ncbi:MAG: hypothetical protein R3E79_55205 [Caldilineaceae bacterium]